MSYEFVSNFKHFIEGLIAEKRALGRKYARNESELRRIDTFCAKEYPDETVLTQEIVMNWALVRSDESFGNLNRRVTPMRQLAKYMWRQGAQAYILPDGFTAKREPPQSAYLHQTGARIPVSCYGLL